MFTARGAHCVKTQRLHVARRRGNRGGRGFPVRCRFQTSGKKIPWSWRYVIEGPDPNPSAGVLSLHLWKGTRDRGCHHLRPRERQMKWPFPGLVVWRRVGLTAARAATRVWTAGLGSSPAPTPARTVHAGRSPRRSRENQCPQPSPWEGRAGGSGPRSGRREEREEVRQGEGRGGRSPGWCAAQGMGADVRKVQVCPEHVGARGLEGSESKTRRSLIFMLS